MFGRCFEGHFHAINPGHQPNENSSEDFFYQCDIFNREISDETGISQANFMVLPPINCPQWCESNQYPADGIFIDSNIPPFTGISDLRTVPEFLSEFESQVGSPELLNDDGKLKLYDLIGGVLQIDSRQFEQMRYRDLRQKFLLTHWSLEKQYEVYSKFKKTTYNAEEDGSVAQYVEFWLYKFFYNGTIILSPEFVEKLINRIPCVNGLQLLKCCKEVKYDWCKILDTLFRCEEDMNSINA